MERIIKTTTSLPIKSGVLLLIRRRKVRISIQQWNKGQVCEHGHFPSFLKKRRGVPRLRDGVV
jgi:hypothetical protein